MEKSISSVENDFIETMSRLGTSLGLNRVVGQIYALLYFRGAPMSLDEICQRLGVSKGNVSINIRELERWGAVKKSWVPGTRKDYYEADSDVVGVVYNRLRMRVEKAVSDLGLNLEKWETGIKIQNSARSAAGNGAQNSSGAGRGLKDLMELKTALGNLLKIAPREVSGSALVKKIAMVGKIKSLFK